MKNIRFLLIIVLSCMFLTSCSQPPVESQSNHAEGAVIGKPTSTVEFVTPPYIAPELENYQVWCFGNKKADITKENLLCDDIRTKYLFTISQSEPKLIYGMEVACSSGDYAISVLDKNGVQIQRIAGNSAVSDMIGFVDFNLDGYVDLQITLAGTQNEPHLIYLWDSESCNFSKLICDEPLYYYESYKGYVTNWIKDGPSYMVIQTLIWDGENTLTLDSEERIDLTNTTDYSIYESETVLASGNPYTVKYAQVCGLNSKQQEDNINFILKDSILSWLTANTEWISRCQTSVMYQSPEYLSICYELIDADTLSNVESTRICVTVDIKNQKRVYLTDFIDFDTLENYLVNYAYDNEFSPPIDSKETQQIISYSSMSERDYLQEMINHDPLALEFTKSYLSGKPSFYLVDNGVCIIRNVYRPNDIFYTFE